MRILKVINNNVVSTLDEKQRETIVMGSGIGFGKKSGDDIDASKIEKKYHLSQGEQSQFEQLVQEIPYQHLQIATCIIDEAKKMVSKEISKSIYITLTDHLNFAIERYKQGIEFDNGLLWEIKKFYTEEYMIGKMAVQIVKDRLGIRLSENEVGFIALHFINAEISSSIDHTVNALELVKDILNIIQYTMQIEFDEDSLSYERLVTHLKHFLARAIKNQCYQEEDTQILKHIVDAYPEEYGCAKKIKAYVEKRTEYQVTDEELLYLTIHINRVKRRL